jgi:hypothetical protein
LPCHRNSSNEVSITRIALNEADDDRFEHEAAPLIDP